jgi:hypothetical protein
MRFDILKSNLILLVEEYENKIGNKFSEIVQIIIQRILSIDLSYFVGRRTVGFDGYHLDVLLDIKSELIKRLKEEYSIEYEDLNFDVDY